MNGDVSPTPTQLENDLAAIGHSVVNKDSDGSPPDTNAPPWTQPEPDPKRRSKQ
jgi:hypothetical protein